MFASSELHMFSARFRFRPRTIFTSSRVPCGTPIVNQQYYQQDRKRTRCCGLRLARHGLLASSATLLPSGHTSKVPAAARTASMIVKLCSPPCASPQCVSAGHHGRGRVAALSEHKARVAGVAEALVPVDEQQAPQATPAIRPGTEN